MKKEVESDDGFEQEEALGFETDAKQKRKKVDIKKQVEIKSKDLESLQTKETEEELGFVQDVQDFEDEK